MTIDVELTAEQLARYKASIDAVGRRHDARHEARTAEVAALRERHAAERVEESAEWSRAQIEALALAILPADR